MSEPIINRRQVGAAMAALAGGVATALPDERPKLPPPEAFGDLHNKIVDGVVRTAGLDQNTLESPLGLRKLIGYLVEYKMLASVKYAANLGAKLTDGEKANIVLKDLSGCMAGGVAALLAGHPELVLLAVLFTAGGLSAAAVGDALATKK